MKKERQQKIGINMEDLIYNPKTDNDESVVIIDEANIVISNEGCYLEDRQTGERHDISSYTNMYYDRDNKNEKIINKMIWNGENDINLNILKKYDGIFSVDTNTCLIKNKKISVTSITQLLKVDASKYIGVITDKIWINDEVNDDEREQFVYAKIIESIVARKFNINRKVIIFIDCDLENLENYNSGKIPLIKNFYLPSGFELAYASSDTGREYVGNILLQECDKSAQKCIKSIKEFGLEETILKSKRKAFNLEVNAVN